MWLDPKNKRVETSGKAQEYYGKLKQSCADLSEFFTLVVKGSSQGKQLGITGIEFLPPEFDTMECLDAQRQYWNGKFAIFPDAIQMKAVADCFAWLLYAKDNDWRHCVLHGLTQIGKALLLSCLRNILPEIHSAMSGMPAVGVIMTPSDVGLGRSMESEDEYHYRTFDKCKIILKGRKISVEGRKARLYGESNHKQLVLRRQSHRIAKFNLKELEAYRGYHLYIFIDEIHEGSDSSGLMSRQFIKILEREGFSFTVIGCTATPSESIGEACKILPILLPDDYLASSLLYIGQEFRTLSGKQPNLLPVHEIETECPQLADAYYKQDPGAVADFFIDFANRNFSKDGCMSLFLRYSRTINNAQRFMGCDRVLEALREKADRNFKLGVLNIVKHFGPSDIVQEEKDIKSYLLDMHKKGEFAIIMSTFGRSNRGESFPKQTEVFFSLANDPHKKIGGRGNMDSDLQSDLGRPCGRGKKSRLYLWRNSKLRIEAIRASEDGTDEQRHHGTRADNPRIKKLRRRRLTTYQDF